MTTIKSLIDAGQLSTTRVFRRSFTRVVNNKVYRGYFLIELINSRSANLYAKMFGSEFPFCNHRVRFSTTIESILHDFQFGTF